MTTLRKEIQDAINRHSGENGSNTPDWILASFLMSCLYTFDCAINEREKWYGRPVEKKSPKWYASETPTLHEVAMPLISPEDAAFDAAFAAAVRDSAPKPNDGDPGP
jgi:hypothetical protein